MTHLLACAAFVVVVGLLGLGGRSLHESGYDAGYLDGRATIESRGCLPGGDAPQPPRAQ